MTQNLIFLYDAFRKGWLATAEGVTLSGVPDGMRTEC